MAHDMFYTCTLISQRERLLFCARVGSRRKLKVKRKDEVDDEEGEMEEGKEKEDNKKQMYCMLNVTQTHLSEP